MKIIAILLLATSLFAEMNEWKGSLHLQVLNMDDAQKTILELNKAQGGYLYSQQNNSLILNVPRQNVEALLDTLRTLGKVVDQNYSTTDLNTHFQQNLQVLKSRQRLLKDYWDLLDSAKTEGFLEVERQIRTKTNEIERLKSDIAYTKYRSENARLTIQFRFYERRNPVNTSTVFPWINNLNLGNLMDDFHQEVAK